LARSRSIRGTIEPMTAPATSPARPAQTHPCARCGAPVGLDAGLCERCNPLGLKDSASSQVHGTVFLAIGLAIAGLAIVAHLAVSDIGPFSARVTAMRAGSTTGALVATIEVRNDGRTTGSATCRLNDPADPALIHSTVVYSPRIAGGGTVTFDQEVAYGSADRPLVVTCTGP
jgi:ribosomal protein L40E